LCKKWEKMSFLNFSGTIGRKTPVETLPARCWVPAWRKVGLKDELLSKYCISVQRFCSAALFLKSTGSTDTEAATVSADFRGGVGEGKTENQQQRFSNLAYTAAAH
jgi:hypothetical protein